MGRLRTLIAVIVGIEALAFLFSALLHTGARISFLPAFFHDPQIRGAPIVEAACGVFLGVAALLVIFRLGPTWGIAVSAHVTSIAADVVGMILIAVGAGPDSPFNYLFHRVGVAILIVVLLSLFTRPVRAAMEHGAVQHGHANR